MNYVNAKRTRSYLKKIKMNRKTYLLTKTENMGWGEGGDYNERTKELTDPCKLQLHCRQLDKRN